MERDKKYLPEQVVNLLRQMEVAEAKGKTTALYTACTAAAWDDVAQGVPVGQPAAGTQRCRAIRREDEDALTQAILQLASECGRYGYRRITALLKRAGWRRGKNRVERISTPRTKTRPRGARYLASRRPEHATEAETSWTALA